MTLDGRVEADASIMNGSNLVYGACGAVPRVKNPICLAYDIYEKQLDPLPLGMYIVWYFIGGWDLIDKKENNEKNCFPYFET